MRKSLFITAFLALFSTIPAVAEPILVDTLGEKIPFSSLKGKWVFIHYWASWCQTCVDELPELNRFYEKNKTKNIALYAVNFDSPSLSEQQYLIQQMDIRFPSLMKNPARDLRLGGIRGVPVTFVFNPEGQLAETLYGPQSIESLREVMAVNPLNGVS